MPHRVSIDRTAKRRAIVSLLLLTLTALTFPLGANDRKRNWRMDPLEVDGPIPYFVAPGLPELGYREEDVQLAEWAIEAWSNATDGVLCFYPATGTKSLLRIYWSPVADGRYGQMQAIPIDKKHGGEVYVLPQLDDVESRSPQIAAEAAADPLFRDAVVYLTLVHEIGHVLGLVHTVEISDAMYFGGDPLTFFRNYRKPLKTRSDIPKFSGLSKSDVSRVRKLYPPGIWLKAKPVEKSTDAQKKSAKKK